MRHWKLFMIAILALFVIGCAPPAEQGETEVPPPPPKAEPLAVDMSTVEAPSPGHETLGMWVGQWKGKGILEESPMGPGGPMEWTEDCDWFGGAKYNVICKSEGTGPMGDTKGLGISGYNPATDEYTHFGIDTSGWTGHSTGTRDGNVFQFTSTETMEGETFYSRFTMDMENPNKMLFSWETSPDGENWTKLMDGVSEKQL